MAANVRDDARQTTLAFLLKAVPLAKRPRLFVRVNGLTTGLTDADLDAVMRGAPDGLVLPKAEGGVDVTHLSAKLAVREAENNLADGQTQILAIATETAKGVFALGTFAGCSHRLAGLAWGAEDLSADLGADTNRQEDGRFAEPYRLARALTLMGAAAAHTMAIDTVFTNFRHLEGLRAECETARRDGFAAKMAIHPAQVAVINAAFTPTPEAMVRARAIVAAFAANPAAGVIGLEGEMLDMPHLRRAMRTLAGAPEDMA